MTRLFFNCAGLLSYVALVISRPVWLLCRITPSTVNGIGTHYYGKSNLQRRRGLCQACRREAWLESYDTRLWFVVVFIPIIPLGRKRIIDQCATCRRHFVANLAKWDEAAQLNTSGAKADYEAAPTPENAIRYHQSLIQFHQHDDARKFGMEMQQRFSTDATLHAYLGQVLLNLGETTASDAAFEQAHKLKPELPAAREGMAYRAIRAGKLEEAEDLLDYLKTPGAVQLYNLTPLDVLSASFKARGKHDRVAALFAILVREIPSLGQNRHYRKAVMQSEKAAGITPSCLPKVDFSMAWLWANYRIHILGLSLALAITVGLLAHNYFLERRQPLHICNSFAGPAEVRIDNDPLVKVNTGHTEITVGEGKHVAHVSGAVTEDILFELKHGFWDRWTAKDVAVLNLGGHAILMEHQAYYRPKSGAGPKDDFAFTTGRRFYMARGIDNPFEPLPKEVKIDSGHDFAKRVELKLFEGSAFDVVGYYLQQNQAAKALGFCENALDADGECDDAAELYAQVAASQKQEARAEKFLKDRIKKRPVQIALHRAWQDVQRVGGVSSVREEYRSMAAKEPNNGALTYLLGRLEEGATEENLFKKASELDPKLSWAWFAQGVSRATVGDWQQALPLYEKAVALRPSNRRFVQKRDEALIGTGGWEQIKRDALATLKLNANSYPATVALIEAQAGLGHPDEAESVATAYVRNNSQSQEQRDDLAVLRYFASYAGAHFQTMLDQAGKMASLPHQRARMEANIELGKMSEAVSEKFLGEGERNFMDALAIALGWKLAHDETKAVNWELKAINSLHTSGEAAASLVQALTSKTPPNLSSVNFSGFEAEQEALFLAWLAVKFPEQKAGYSEMARRFNIRLVFPHHLVVKALQP